MFKFSAFFSIVMIIAIFFSLGLRDWRIGLKIVAVAAVFIVTWKILRK